MMGDGLAGLSEEQFGQLKDQLQKMLDKAAPGKEVEVNNGAANAVDG